jgi:putative hemin transport protein
LGVSELELLELQLNENVVRLNPDFTTILPEVKSLGTVMALTRNPWVVHERKGIYDNVSFIHGGTVGLAVNPDIDLRLFMTRWKYAYAVTQTGAQNRTLKSLQFFNPAGEAIHKIYLTQQSDENAYHAMVARFKSDNQNISDFVAEPLVENPGSSNLNPAELEEFQNTWKNLKDTHDFFPMLKKFNLSRTAAMRLAPEGFTKKIGVDRIPVILEKAAKEQVPIMVFVENEACIQIHTGEINKILPMDTWINVMDPMFNLHLNLEGVAEAWITKKPTEDGIVTGVELFDAQGKLLVYFFGKRKPGIPELETWRTLVAEL